MARTSDPHSATAQFFINVADNAFLDHTRPPGRAGATASSARWSRALDVVDKIRAVRTGRSGGHSDVPEEDVIIERAEADA